MHGETAGSQRQELTPVGERETTKKKNSDEQTAFHCNHERQETMESSFQYAVKMLAMLYVCIWNNTTQRRIRYTHIRSCKIFIRIS